MWHCPNCGEQHEGNFDICWKCGSDPDGDRDPDFQVSEPVTESDQALVSPAGQTERPDLQLPTVTYFSIPPFMLLTLVMLFRQQPTFNQVTLASMGQIEFALAVIFMVIFMALVGIPVWVAGVRGMFLYHRHRNGPATMADLLWILMMFRLPEGFCRTHRWFVFVYYGSLVTAFIGHLGVGGWHLQNMMSLK